MPNTFDRFLIRSFYKTLLISFVSILGIYIVFDLFHDVDDFTRGNATADRLGLIGSMATFYGYKSIFVFDKLSAALGSGCIAIVLLVCQRRSELHVILAAGVPTYRVAMPLIVCGASVIGLKVLNRELVIPEIAQEEFEDRGEPAASSRPVQMIYDYEAYFVIDGDRVYPRLAMLENPKIVLLPDSTVYEMTTLRSHQAVYLEKTADRRAGWLLENCHRTFDSIPLTPRGRQFVQRMGNDSKDLFIVSEIPPDMLFHRENIRLSTGQMVHRLKNPAFRGPEETQVRFEIHKRIAEPFRNLLALFLTIPLVARREGRDLYTNMAVWCLILTSLFLVTKFVHQLANAGGVSYSLAAFVPVILTGAFAAWYSFEVQT